MHEHIHTHTFKFHRSMVFIVITFCVVKPAERIKIGLPRDGRKSICVPFVFFEHASRWRDFTSQICLFKCNPLQDVSRDFILSPNCARNNEIPLPRVSPSRFSFSSAAVCFQMDLILSSFPGQVIGGGLRRIRMQFRHVVDAKYNWETRL